MTPNELKLLPNGTYKINGKLHARKNGPIATYILKGARTPEGKLTIATCHLGKFPELSIEDALQWQIEQECKFAHYLREKKKNKKESMWISQEQERKNKLPHKLAKYEDAKTLPIQAFLSGVYFLRKGPKVVYVGQSTCMAARIGTHYKNQIDFDSVCVVPLPKHQLIVTEKEFIKKFKPSYNKTGV